MQTARAFGALLILAAGVAQTASAETGTTAEVTLASVVPPGSQTPPELSYQGHELKVSASNVSVGDLLTRIGRLLNITIDVPPEMAGKAMSFVKYGPGPAREVIASLLRDSHWNFAIQDADNNGQILSVLLLGPSNKRAEDERPSAVARNPYVRAAAPEPAEPEPVEAPPLQPAPGATANPSSGAEPPPAPEAPQNPLPALEALPASPYPAPSSQGLRPGALTPPPTLNSQSINSQLQQMYQQRQAMAQQSRSNR